MLGGWTVDFYTALGRRLIILPRQFGRGARREAWDVMYLSIEAKEGAHVYIDMHTMSQGFTMAIST